MFTDMWLRRRRSWPARDGGEGDGGGDGTEAGAQGERGGEGKRQCGRSGSGCT